MLFDIVCQIGVLKAFEEV